MKKFIVLYRNSSEKEEYIKSRVVTAKNKVYALLRAEGNVVQVMPLHKAEILKDMLATQLSQIKNGSNKI